MEFLANNDFNLLPCCHFKRLTWLGFNTKVSSEN